MASDRSLLEREMERVELRPFTLAEFHRRRERKQRNRRMGTGVLALVLSAAALAGLLQALGDIRPGPRPAELPTTPRAWNRFSIERPPVGQGTFANPNHVFVAGSRLVAWGVENLEPEKGLAQAFEPVVWASDDGGRRWSRAPLWPGAQDGDLSVPVPARPGLVALLGQQVWISEDGLTWERGPADPDLSGGAIRSLVAAEQGLVAVGGTRAWFSSDGLDWERAAVPELPPDLLRKEAYGGYFDEFFVDTFSMTAVAASPDRLVAVGEATLEWDLFSDQPLTRPVIWTSTDGRAWTEVPIAPDVFPPAEAGPNPAGGPGVKIQDPGSRIDHIAWGPGGFVAVGSEGGALVDAQRGARLAAIAVWVSPDGLEWERVSTNAFTSRWPIELNEDGSPVLFGVNDLAAGPAGYVAVGVDGGCRFGSDPPTPCPSAYEAVVWTSSDGRSWSRLPSGSLFRPAQPGRQDGPPETVANSVVPWGSRFVVVGTYGQGAAVWISSLAGDRA
jgi:hypothetical protein